MDRAHALYVIGSPFAIYGTAYLVTAFSFPGTFWSVFSLENNHTTGFLDPTFADTIKKWARWAFAISGLGYLLFRASAPLVDWIPFDWGSHDEGGDWVAFRDTVRTGLTFVGVIWALFTAERVNSVLRRQDRK